MRFAPICGQRKLSPTLHIVTKLAYKRCLYIHLFLNFHLTIIRTISNEFTNIRRELATISMLEAHTKTTDKNEYKYSIYLKNMQINCRNKKLSIFEYNFFFHELKKNSFFLYLIIQLTILLLL